MKSVFWKKAVSRVIPSGGRIRALAFLAALGAFGAPPCAANGGGYNKGGVYASVIPFEMGDINRIAMETEDLRIDVGPKSSEIRVRYTMRNTTDDSVICRFGFPLDGMSEGAVEDVRYMVTARGRPLPYQRVKEQREEEPNVIYIYGKSVDYWMVSELTAAPHETFELEIRVKAPNYVIIRSISEHGTTKTQFRYRFSSAAVWNGPIVRGHVEIAPAGIDPAGLKILKPANRFTRRQDGVWVWDFAHLEPTLDDDVTVQVCPDIGWDSSTLIDEERKEEWSENHVLSYGGRWMRGVDIGDWSMSASHTSSRPIAHTYRDEEVVRPFDVAQLPLRRRYHRHDDVWGTDAPGYGVGQSVTLTFKEPVAIGVLGIKNGWGEGYGRVTKLKVIVNGQWSREFALDGVTYLPLFDSPAARTVRLVITAAEPGLKFPETCLSDLFVFRRLSREPSLDPCR